MEFSFNREVRNQLNEVDSRFKSGLLRSWPELNTFVNRLEGDSTWEHLPIMTLVFYHYLNIDSKLTSAMVNIFKNLYLSQSIHSWVMDDEEGQEYNQELQFSILIGDYIFGYILKLLLDNQAEKLINSFSMMMCNINEGLVRKHALLLDTEQALKEIKAPLYSTAFQTAAQLAGCNSENICARLGFDIGMAIELLHLGMNNQADQYVHSSFELLSDLKHRSASGSILERALHELHDRACAQERAAVI